MAWRASACCFLSCFFSLCPKQTHTHMSVATLTAVLCLVMIARPLWYTIRLNATCCAIAGEMTPPPQAFLIVPNGWWISPRAFTLGFRVCVVCYDYDNWPMTIFAALHEVAHVSCLCSTHQTKFSDYFSRLLHIARRRGALPPDYALNSHYCGVATPRSYWPE